MKLPVAMLVSAAALAAQLETPPSFDERPGFRKGTAGPIDASSHVGAKGEVTNTNLAALFERFVPPATESYERSQFDRGYALARDRHYAAAAETFAAGPGGSESLRAGAALATYLSGKQEEAVPAIAGLARDWPRDLRLVALLGETAGSAQARSAGYEAALRGFVRSFPSNAESRYYLAQMLAAGAAEPPAESVALWLDASRLDRTDPRPCLELARYAAQPPDAIRWLEEALRRDGKLADAHYRLSRLYAKQGDAKRSADHLERFRQLR